MYVLTYKCPQQFKSTAAGLVYALAWSVSPHVFDKPPMDVAEEQD